MVKSDKVLVVYKGFVLWSTLFQSSTLFATGSTLTHSAYVCPYRAEPKKKKVDSCKEQMVPPELIPIDYFISMHLAGVEARFGSHILSLN